MIWELGTLAGCRIVLGSNCRIGCGEPMMERDTWGTRVACKLVASTVELELGTSWIRMMPQAGSSSEVDIPAPGHHYKWGRKGLS